LKQYDEEQTKKQKTTKKKEPQKKAAVRFIEPKNKRHITKLEIALLSYIERREKQDNYKRYVSFFCFKIGLGFFNKKEKIDAANFVLKIAQKKPVTRAELNEHFWACTQGELGAICKSHGISARLHNTKYNIKPLKHQHQRRR
jgi:hypothetical protein